MAATAPAPAHNQGPTNPRSSNLDVEWLLHPKRDFSSFHAQEPARSQRDAPSDASARKQVTDSAQTQSPPRVPSPPKSSTSPPTELQRPRPVHASSAPAVPPAQQTPPPAHQHHQHHQQHVGHKPHLSRSPSEDSTKSSKSSKKEGRRGSWFSSLGHKISGSSASRSSSIDSTSNKTPALSPKPEFQNPFDKSNNQQPEEQRPVVVPQSPRRPSVLVAAGSETKLDNPGFLTNALRRLSSSNSAALGKGAGVGAIQPRKLMNIDYNRERAKIKEFDQNKLRRVAFCVDVEIAGVAAQSEEENANPGLDPIGHPATSNLSKTISPPEKKDASSAKLKEKGEGAALKNPEHVKEQKENLGQTKVDAIVEAQEVHRNSSDSTRSPPPEKAVDSTEKPTTKKKEKKKRSEAERRERKERKKRHAEANGLVPLEIFRDDTGSSSSSGASTPRNSDGRTTDPLRIYKRCCQLRETTAQNLVKEQIQKPAATLAEAPGAVAIIDLSGSRMSLHDIVTLSDWLAVVPVRKLILEDCGLGDEAIRIILSSLLSCKTQEQARQNRKLPIHGSTPRAVEQMGIIEKLSLKNNPAITSIGWRYIALFMHMSRSLVAIDLTGIPYPKSAGDLSRESSGNGISVPTNGNGDNSSLGLGSLIARALEERIGSKLEELILSGCSLSTSNLSEIVDAAVQRRIRRLGLAGNRLNNDAIGHVVRYMSSGSCDGLDLGSNDLHSHGHLLLPTIDQTNPMFALSLADCNLTADDLSSFLPRLCELKNFKFIDLSRNHDLFKGEANAVSILRRYLPRMMALKRLHLVDVNMTPEQLMALTDVLPDCPSLAHFTILENADLIRTMDSAKVESQEEAAAFLTSLMTATRISKTLMAVELEAPSPEASEVVRALSSQILAYSLRNMERLTSNDPTIGSKVAAEGNALEVLLHIVGHMEGYPNEFDNESPAPDEDYLIASTGVVRALSVCLDRNGSHANSRQITPTGSGTATPKQGLLRPPTQQPKKKPRDVSRQLCDSARKIKNRIQPALAKEDKAGHGDEYHRLRMLDETLDRIIKRFEEEYPDLHPNNAQDEAGSAETSPTESPAISRVSSLQDGSKVNATGIKFEHVDSATTQAAKELTHEEGRMLRFGQVMRREIFRPTGTDDFAHGTSVDDDPEPAHLEALRGKLAGWSGDQIRETVDREGADTVVEQLKINLEELRLMEREDPVGFEALLNSTLGAEIRSMNGITT